MLESIRVSFSSLKSNKMRSALTMLGIIIGTGAVITVIALGKGAGEAVQRSIQSLGSNLIFVRPGAARSGFVRLQSGSSTLLSNADAKAIQERCPSVTSVVPESFRFGQLKYQNKNWNSQVVGTLPEYQTVRNVSLREGSFFTEKDLLQKERICILGFTVYENLFGNQPALGKTIKINGINFTVKGILEPKGQMAMFNQDDQVFIPLSTAQKRLLGIDFLSNINIQAKSELHIDQAALEIEKLLRKRHKLQGYEENDFNVRTQLDILATREETSRTFSLLLAGIALVSLLVGGIGIMNIMLVSVTERTREIGIRMAIGARRRDILSQFLIEALVLSVLGGMLGILLGVLGSVILSKAANWNTLIAPSSILIAFFFSALVGIFFGLYPARKASGLDPIEALRYE
ncbi:MAG: multidrug ABC transporter substrate-binding protein [candidate division Zixibacteria bacterium RBG_19FT_COMBO_42_43]|nr:MAG: multidrug ABC transporter substrate-binding protein [candidate division Zixibacteria bacterium RBG_19FT_COMBO_42_43]